MKKLLKEELVKLVIGAVFGCIVTLFCVYIAIPSFFDKKISEWMRDTSYEKLAAALGRNEGLRSYILPVGAILPFAGDEVPNGWLLCDGRSLAMNKYPQLYKVIKFAWGTGHSVGTGETFSLPDLRGRFLRGLDSGAQLDPDRGSRTACNAGGNEGDKVGSVQRFATAFRLQDCSVSLATGERNTTKVLTTIAKLEKRAFEDSETRPVNAYVNWIIRCDYSDR